MKKFTLAAAFAALTLSASAQSVVTESTATSLQTIQNATDVVIIGVSEEVHKAFEQFGTIKADYSVDDNVNFLYVWDNTYVGGTPSGMNSLGVAEGWFSFVVQNVGWSGCGFAGVAPGKDMSVLTDDHILHIAFKSNDNATHVLGVGESKMALGDAAFPDNGSTIPVLENFPRDGKWYAYDIPMSVLKNFVVGDVMFKDDPKAYKGNAVWFLSGGVAGTTLDFDQVFFYKKGNVDPSGISSVKAENANATMYNLAGRKVGADYKGIVVKNGKKFMNK